MTDVTVVVVEEAAPAVDIIEPGPQGSAGPPGTTDHHELVHLAEGDDHPQYHNDARGDARYEQLGSVAAGVAAGVAAEANVRSQADTAETAARTAADGVEAAARAAADTAEANARSQADATLQGHLDAEATTRADADATLTTNLDAETTARTAADATLTQNLGAETAARTAADTAEANARAAAVAAEANSRATADTALGGRVDAETAARTAADATLTQDLGTEATARAAADTALGGRVDGEAASRAAADIAETNARVAADAAHVAAPDPHAQYLTQPRGDARYLTGTAADGRYDAAGDASSALASAHVYTDTAIAGVVPLSMRGAANGVATLDGAGLIPTSQLPPLAISQPFTVTDMNARLALNAQRGDTAYQSDEGTWWILATDSPATAADWKRLTPPGVVTSVNGKVGPAVNLSAADVGALTQAQGDARYDTYGAASVVQAALQPQITANAGAIAQLDAAVVHKAGTDPFTVADPVNPLLYAFVNADAIGVAHDRSNDSTVYGTVITENMVTITDPTTGHSIATIGGTGGSYFESPSTGVVALTIAPDTYDVGQTANLTEWWDFNTDPIASVGPTGMATFPAGVFRGTDASVVPLTVQGASGLTADLQQWRDGNAVVQLAVDASGNLRFGSITMAAPLVGTENTRLGVAALSVVTTGSDNEAFGFQALAALGTGTTNTAVGSLAGSALTSGSSNVLVGRRAGQGLTTSGSNVAIGGSTIRTVAGASTSVVIGDSAGFNYAGTAGVVIGANAGQSLTGANNTAVGYQGLGSITTGGNNTALGAGTNGAATTSNATYVGYSARKWTSGGDGSNGTAVGANTFVTNNAVALGSGARAITAGSVAIGVDSAGTGALSNVADQIVLGTTLSKTLVPGTFQVTAPTGTSVPITVKAQATQTSDLTQWQGSAGSTAVLAKVTAIGEYESGVAAVSASDVGGGKGGIVLKSPNGTRYRMTVADDGALTTVAA